MKCFFNYQHGVSVDTKSPSLPVLHLRIESDNYLGYSIVLTMYEQMFIFGEICNWQFHY